MSVKLNPDKGLIFRITHVKNVPWILENGLHCKNSDCLDPNFISIGNTDLIAARRDREVEGGPGGTLSDYVSFYFTPFSIMMLNIKTGHGGIERRRNSEIVILVSSLPRLSEIGKPFVFTDRHAYTAFASFYDDPAKLEEIDWDLLRARDFRHDPDDPGKKERYQAEALVYQHVPLEALVGIGCYDVTVQKTLEKELAERGLDLNVKVTRQWYF